MRWTSSLHALGPAVNTNLFLLLRDPVQEVELLRALEQLTGIACDNMACPSEAAPAFFMALDYPEGFRRGVSLLGRPGWDLHIEIKVLAFGLANRFQTEVLFEAPGSISDTNGEHWLLASPGQGELSTVKIEELSDGVRLAGEV
jgi:hypothetical protein